MNKNHGQFVDRYLEMNEGYVHHKQQQYKTYNGWQSNLPPIYYTETLFWNELIPLGWRKDQQIAKDGSTIDSLVLVCKLCEGHITRVVRKNWTHLTNVRFMLDVKDKIEHHEEGYCKAIAKD